MTPEQTKNTLSKFSGKSFRPLQEEAIRFAMESDKRFIIIEAPTGAGKSLLGMTCGVMGGQSNYLCSTKILQTQLVTDFPEARNLWGRNNYRCTLDPTKMCDSCIATKKNPCSHPCPYKIAKADAIAAPLRIMNYAYYLTEANAVGRFRDTPLTIIDEADALEGTLVGHIALSFTERTLFRLGLEMGPKRKTADAKDGIESWKEFVGIAQERATEIWKKLTEEIDGFDTIKEDWQLQKIRERDHFSNTVSRCKMFIRNVDRDWLMEEIERQGSRQAVTTFRPLWVTMDLAEEFLWQHSGKWILMSASFLPIPVVCKTLGIDQSEVAYKAIPSNFPIERRPINIWPVASMTYKTQEIETPKLISGIKKILVRHPNERGIIHCVSYNLGKTIIDRVRDKRLFTHSSADRQETVDMFTGASQPNAVLVSPSLTRGLSLAGDLCRFVIVAKAPFLSVGDKVVSQRLYGSGQIGKLWYESQMMLDVLQACGRGMRSADDYCVCYLIDEQVNRVYRSKPNLWPAWFTEAENWDDNPLIDMNWNEKSQSWV